MYVFILRKEKIKKIFSKINFLIVRFNRIKKRLFTFFLKSYVELLVSICKIYIKFNKSISNEVSTYECKSVVFVAILLFRVIKKNGLIVFSCF